MANPVFPNGIKQWTDKRDFIDDVESKHINEAYAEIIAIETELYGATPDATPDKYIKRDIDGRAKIAAPNADMDIANKEYVDDEIKNNTPELLAGKVEYNNTKSELESVNVQDAIDEMVADWDFGLITNSPTSYMDFGSIT